MITRHAILQQKKYWLTIFLEWSENANVKASPTFFLRTGVLGGAKTSYRAYLLVRRLCDRHHVRPYPLAPALKNSRLMYL